MSRERPKVSVLLPVHNYERFVEQSLTSALEQDYPPELLEIIVVDDGSTDGSVAAVRGVMDRHPGRVKLVQQTNSGQVATIARAAAEASGELLAPLDADDVWLPDKTAKQVAAYLEQPNVGVVFCDMTTIDTNGRVLADSLYQPGEPDMDPVRLYARVLRSNVIYGGCSMYRADLFGDAPAEIEAWDWLLSIRAARMRAEGRLQIAFVPEALALYRQHGDNMLLGASGAKLVALRQRQLRFQLWAIRNGDLSPLGPAELNFVWGGAEWFATTASEATGSRFLNLVSISDQERARAEVHRAKAAQAAETGDLVAECRLLLQALAWDPYEPEGFEALQAAVLRAITAQDAPHPLRDARPFVVLASAGDLLADDQMILRYASAMAELETVTLAVDTEGMGPEAAIEGLRAMLERCDLAERDDIDIVAVVDSLDLAQRFRMRSAASARYVASATDADAEDGGPPRFTPARLEELRRLALDRP